MSTNAPSVEKLLNFRLWRLLTLASAPVIRLCEGRYGIARREWALLATMAGHAQGLPPSVLAERVGVDRAQVSKTCAALVNKGLIERTAVRGDSRRATFALTEKGRALHAEIHAEVMAINARVASALDAAQTEAFHQALDLLTEQAAKVNRELLTDVSADRSRTRARQGRTPRAG